MPFNQGAIRHEEASGVSRSRAALAVAGRPSRRTRAGPRSRPSAARRSRSTTAVPPSRAAALDALLKQLPADRIWRAGENQVTTLTTEGDVTIGGKKVPAGKYSVYVHAAEGNAWDLVLNRDLGVPLGQDLGAGPREHEERALAAPRRTTRRRSAARRSRASPMTAARPPAPADDLHDLVRARRATDRR